MQDFECAAARRAEVSPIKRFVQAGRRLLQSDKLCERCQRAPATIADGRGTGWCQRCSDTVLAERRAGFTRLEEAQRAIDLAREALRQVEGTREPRR